MEKTAKKSQHVTKTEPKFIGWIVSLILVALILLAASLFLPLFRSSNGGLVIAGRWVSYLVLIFVVAAILAAKYFLKTRTNKSLAIFGALNIIPIILASTVVLSAPNLVATSQKTATIHPSIGGVLYFVAIAGLFAQWISLFLYRKIEK